MDETRHGDEVTKEDETVMDADQGNSMFLPVEERKPEGLANIRPLQCSHTSYHNYDRAPTSAE